MNQATKATHDLDQLSESLVTTFSLLNCDEQPLASAIYQQLALGEALSLERLAKVLNQTENTIKEQLAKWGGIFYDDSGDIIGFWGITAKEMKHQMVMAGKTSYAWCAWDTLFIPELVGTTAEVSSRCTTTDEAIHLTVTPHEAKSKQADIWLSFLLPDEKAVQENVTTSFCHFVHFFSSKTAGETWTAQNEGTFLLTLDDAFKVGKKVNAARYTDIL